MHLVHLISKSGDMFSHDGEAWTRDAVFPATGEEVMQAMRERGRWVATPSQGYWLFDGQMIPHPAEELGEEFGEVCEYVETSPSTSAFVREYSDDQIAGRMAAVEAAGVASLKAATLRRLAQQDAESVLVAAQMERCASVKVQAEAGTFPQLLLRAKAEDGRFLSTTAPCIDLQVKVFSQSQVDALNGWRRLLWIQAGFEGKSFKEVFAGGSCEVFVNKD